MLRNKAVIAGWAASAVRHVEDIRIGNARGGGCGFKTANVSKTDGRGRRAPGCNRGHGRSFDTRSAAIEVGAVDSVDS